MKRRTGPATSVHRLGDDWYTSQRLERATAGPQ
jgi:hypothetical protein